MNWSDSIAVSDVVSIIGIIVMFAIAYVGWSKAAKKFSDDLSRELGTTNANIEALKEQGKEHKEDFKTACVELKQDIRSLVGNVINLAAGQNAVASHSPLALTEIGEELAEKINASDLRDRYANLAPVTDTMNAYEIQQTCRQFAIDDVDGLVFSEDDLQRLQELAFRDGDMVETYRIVLAILIRDWWLKKLDMPLAEVDQYDPSSS